ncbi:MAG: hypothetical protein AAGC57_07280 [Pseudomonadota bacterium]
MGENRDMRPEAGRAYDDLLAGSLFMGRTNRLDELFYAERARPPLVIWDPNRIDLQDAEFEAFVEQVNRLPTVRGLPLASAFDPARFMSREWLMLLESIGFGGDFRYLFYGSGVAEYYGRSLTGRRTSAIGGHISRFFIALYRAAMHRRQRVLSEHEPPSHVFVRIWRRLIVPLVDDTGFVTHFAVLNIPENHLRSGLEVVPFPCIVADRARMVRFANAEARRLAAPTRVWEYGEPLAALLGQDLVLPDEPEALLGPPSNPLQTRVSLDLPGRPGTPCQVHVGAARYRNEAIFVLTILPPIE